MVKQTVFESCAGDNKYTRDYVLVKADHSIGPLCFARHDPVHHAGCAMAGTNPCILSRHESGWRPFRVISGILFENWRELAEVCDLFHESTGGGGLQAAYGGING